MKRRASVRAAAGSCSGRSPWEGPRSTWPPSRCVFARIGQPPARARRARSPNVLELHTSYNTGALWGFGRDAAAQQPDLRGALGRRRPWRSATGCSSRAPPATGRLTVALGLIMAGALGNCYDRLVLRPRPRLRPLPRRSDRLRLRDLQLRRQHAGRSGPSILMLLALRPEPPRRRPRPKSRPPTAEPVRPERLTRPRPEPDVPSLDAAAARSDVVIERELVGVGPDPEGLDLVGLLVPDPGVDHVGGEDVAAEQEVVVGAEGVERGFERARGGRARRPAPRAGGRRCPCRAGRRAGSCSGCRRARP